MSVSPTPATAPQPISDTSSCRESALLNWLHSHTKTWMLQPESLAPASSDASFRRYFRVQTQHPTHASLIIMDAPPAHEDCRPFIQVAKLFADAGVQVPQVLEQDLTQGFLLLTDLGHTTYLQKLDVTHARALYTDATDALLRIQLASRPGVLPDYTPALLLREMQLFPDWYIQRHLNTTLDSTQTAALWSVFEALNRNIATHPQVYVHRDYHSRNLMVLEQQNPGILDFQDAVYGPLTYDLISLWRDAYIDWDEAEQIDWVVRYWEKARKAGLPVASDFGEFYRDYEWMGLQRHLKVLGIFARLHHRDGKDGYLKDLPRVMRYTRAVAARYNEFDPLLRLLDQLENREPVVGYTF